MIRHDNYNTADESHVTEELFSLCPPQLSTLKFGVSIFAFHSDNYYATEWCQSFMTGEQTGSGSGPQKAPVMLRKYSVQGEKEKGEGKGRGEEGEGEKGRDGEGAALRESVSSSDRSLCQPVNR